MQSVRVGRVRRSGQIWLRLETTTRKGGEVRRHVAVERLRFVEGTTAGSSCRRVEEDRDAVNLGVGRAEVKAVSLSEHGYNRTASRGSRDGDL